MITVDVLEADADTLVAEIDMAHVVDGSVEDPIEGEGLGELAVGLESPNRSHLTKGRVLRWNLGEEPYHSIVDGNGQVSKTESHSLAPRQITVRGPGLIGQWADVRVKQWPGMQHVPYYTRHFNYASPGKASEINGTAYEHGLVLDFDALGQPNNPAQPPPNTWRDPTAVRIWTAAYSGSQAVGTSLFRKTFTADETKILRQHATADDRELRWVGGVPVGKGADTPSVGWHDTYPSTTQVIDGYTYDCVYRCENEFSTPPFSIAWLGVAAWLLDSDSEALTDAALAFHSDDTFSALECIDDPTPGWTVPELLEVLLGEWQAAAGLTGWAIVDATPGEWTPMLETNFETQKTTGLGVLTQLADGQAEFAVVVDAGVKELHCYAPGLMGTFHTSPADPPELEDVDVTDLSHQWVQS